MRAKRAFLLWPPFQFGVREQPQSAAHPDLLPWRLICLAALPISVFFLCEMFIDHVSSTPDVSATISNSDRLRLAEAAARIKAVSAYILVLAASVVAIAVFAGDMRRHLPPRAIRRLMLAYLGCALACSVFLKIGTYAGLLKKTGDILGPKLFSAATTFSNSVISIAGLIDTTSYFLPLAAGAVIFGSISTLATDGSGESMESWQQRGMRLRRFLHIGAALLVSGVLFHSLWTSWVGVPLLTSGDDKVMAAYGDLVAGYTSAKGVQYSVLIMSYYVPVAWIMLQQRPPVAEEEAPKGQPPQFTLPPWESLKTIASILAPLLVGILGELAQAIGK